MTVEAVLRRPVDGNSRTRYCILDRRRRRERTWVGDQRSKQVREKLLLTGTRRCP